jgi:hypothetical protein
VVNCGGAHAREAWVIACEGALKKFRHTYVALPNLPSPASKFKREVEKDGWDPAIEEKLKREVEARRNAVSKARMLQANADKMLDEARAEHLRLDRQLRLSSNFPGLSKDFIDGMPHGEGRHHGEGEAGGGRISIKEMESAIAAAKKKSDEAHKQSMQKVQDVWQGKVKHAEKQVFELGKEVHMYKEMALKEQGLDGLEDLFETSPMEHTQDASLADTWNGESTRGREGERLMTAGSNNSGSTLALTRPVTSLDDGKLHVFFDGGQAVLLTKGEDAMMKTTLLGVGFEEEVVESGVSRNDVEAFG